ncbi:tyrosine-type recombinase/integrase [Sulfitobacter sp. 1A13353]|uniref:tyrosine-type recombinase/integrase n=1 Tax=Sulfitobacter sp. 1A13353 TaxID=3368568 RepID=UPI0037450FB0
MADSRNDELFQSSILETESGRYYINGSEQIIAPSTLSWESLFKALDQAEEEWREWLFQGLLTPFKEHAADPLTAAKKSSADTSTELTFRLYSDYGAQKKFRFIARQFIFFDWMNRHGYLPDLHRRQVKRSKFPKGFDVVGALDSLAIDDTRAMWSSILLDKATRIPLTSGYQEPSLAYDLEEIRHLAKNYQRKGVGDTLSFLNLLMDDSLKAASTNASSRLRKFSAFRFLAHLSSSQRILLPAPKLASHPNELSRIYPAFVRRYAIRKLSGKRMQELIAGTCYLANAHKGARQLRNVDFLVLFCAGNYGTSNTFAPEYLALAQTATAGTKNNYRPYFQGIKNFHALSTDEARGWDARLKGRNSVAVAGSNFALFQERGNLVKAALPVQVSNYEKKSGLRFPSSFDQGVIDWTHILDRYIRQLPRIGTAQAYSSATHWITYLSTLSITERPRNFSEVDRERHIRSNNGTKNTYVAFLKANGLGTRQRLRDLYQVMQIWQSEQKHKIHLPVEPKIDWINSKKSFRTKRKAIPSIIIETLIEENARGCSAGNPYASYRNWIETRKSPASILLFDGMRADAKIPSVPAIIDCILHFGMRSSSARWLDSGQVDEYTVDPTTGDQFLNLSKDAMPGVRNGFLQRMQVGPNQWVKSFLMLKNKTTDIHEIPYAPDELIERLLFVLRMQQTYNELSEPVRAVEDEQTTNNLDDAPLIYPLFRDPSHHDSKPVSYIKVANWWVELLKRCEPIVNEKRKVYYGSNCDYYDFFDSYGKPLWDIHSIRVTVITALLEMGVSPTIIQHLVGHKSFMMTLHYQAVDAGKVNYEISQALEARRIAAADAISNARNEDELEEAIEAVMGGLASSVSGGGIGDATRYAFANGKTLKSSPGAFSVFSHGICPAGDCAQGGAKRGNIHLAVHRDKACSRCRFRITGPAFLAGLEMNANILMNEISDSIIKEENLNSELLALNRTGRPSAVLESRLEQEREYRDEVWADWAAEYQTIKDCLKLAANDNMGSDLPALPNDVSVHFSEKSRLQLLHDIVGKSKMIAGGAVDLPHGIEEVRNDMLWDIAIKSGNVAQYLITLSKDERTAALQKFGDMICKHFDEFGQDSDALFRYDEKMLKIMEPSAERGR